VAADEAERCWVPADPVEGTAGWVGGHLEGADGTVDLAVADDDRVAGTGRTYDDGTHGQAVFVLTDPRQGDDGDDVRLLAVGEDRDGAPLLVDLPTC
jgi:hypothetical protein